jgi:ferredoxin
MPLAADKYVDFGLQDFCNKCNKCARECPCDAIPYGDKILFNGYEIWKPDVQRCGKEKGTQGRGISA